MLKTKLNIIKITLWLVISAFNAQAQDFTNGKWVDLTHAFDENSVYWPTADTFEKTTVFEGKTDGGFYYSAYNFAAAEHGGTHLDSPIHFYKGRKSVDQIPIEQLIGKAVVIDISHKAQKNRNYQLSVADILAFEKQHGKIADGSILLINTGSSKLYGDLKKYMGTNKRGAEGVKALNFPGIHPDAARFIANKRKIKAVGLDSPSLDYGKSTLFESHVVLFKNNIPGFENVANVNLLPPTGATVIALPMKIRGGSGGPLRIVAFVPEK
jgi:kynurenine formamidase